MYVYTTTTKAIVAVADNTTTTTTTTTTSVLRRSLEHKYRMALVDAIKTGGGVDFVEFLREEVNWQQYREKHKMYRDHAMEVTENDFKDVIREMTAHFDGLTHTKIAEEWRGYENLITLLLRHFNVAPGVVIEDGVESEDEVSLPANFSEWLKQPTDHLG